MAKYWEHLEYHEDTVEKHKITEDEIRFLKELQKEMNTQDSCGQADPRYWVIRDFGKVYGEKLNNPDGFTVYMVIHVHPIWAVCILFTHRIGTKIVRVPIEEEDDAVDDTVDDVYGMDWNEEDSNESGRDKF